VLTKQQIDQLVDDFQIDSVNILREYLQIIFLNYLYKEKVAEKIYFKGGTCLRLLYNSPRFSEDLDFSTNLTAKTTGALLLTVIKKMGEEVPGLKLKFLWQGKKALRYRLHWQRPELKFPLNIRLDFAFEKILAEPNVIRISTKMPITSFSLILCLKEEEIFAEKIRAFLTRAKGRDIFDLWHLIDRRVEANKSIIQKKLKEVGMSFREEAFFEKIKNYSNEKIKRDLTKFIPKSQRKIIPLLKQKILEKEIKGLE